MDDASLLAEIDALLQDPPDLTQYDARNPSILAWVGRAKALVRSGASHNFTSMAAAADYLTVNRAMNAAQFMTALHSTREELVLTVRQRPGKQFGPGAVYDAMREIRSVLAEATTSVLVVDGYIDAEIFDLFISCIPARAAVRLLSKGLGADVVRARDNFQAQYNRDVSLRSSRAVHDRVFFVDSRTCYVLGASIKDAAKKSPTYLAPLPADIVSDKLANYDALWDAATAH